MFVVKAKPPLVNNQAVFLSADFALLNGNKYYLLPGVTKDKKNPANLAVFKSGEVPVERTLRANAKRLNIMFWYDLPLAEKKQALIDLMDYFKQDVDEVARVLGHTKEYVDQLPSQNDEDSEYLLACNTKKIPQKETLLAADQNVLDIKIPENNIVVREEWLKDKIMKFQHKAQLHGEVCKNGPEIVGEGLHHLYFERDKIKKFFNEHIHELSEDEGDALYEYKNFNMHMGNGKVIKDGKSVPDWQHMEYIIDEILCRTLIIFAKALEWEKIDKSSSKLLELFSLMDGDCIESRTRKLLDTPPDWYWVTEVPKPGSLNLPDINTVKATTIINSNQKLITQANSSGLMNSILPQDITKSSPLLDEIKYAVARALDNYLTNEYKGVYSVIRFFSQLSPPSTEQEFKDEVDNAQSVDEALKLVNQFISENNKDSSPNSLVSYLRSDLDDKLLGTIPSDTSRLVTTL